MKLNDAELVRRVLDGERAPFEELMRRSRGRLHQTIRSILRNEQEVEDAMQQSYLLAYSHLKEFNGASTFSTWLTRIAMNEALGCIRRRSRFGPVTEVYDFAEDWTRPALVTPEERAAEAQAMRFVEAAVAKLPSRLRGAFQLREYEQLSTGEASAALGVTQQTVKIRLHRARAALRKALGAHALLP